MPTKFATKFPAGSPGPLDSAGCPPILRLVTARGEAGDRVERGRHGSLEIFEDLEFQRRSWFFQRIGWVFLSLVIVAALLGLFGPGLLNGATAGSREGSFWVEYPRFARWKSPMVVRVHLGAGQGTNGETRVWVSRSYLEAMAVQQVSPTPRTVVIGSDRHTFIFATDASGAPSAITLHLKPDEFGSVHARAGLENGTGIALRHFIYP